MLCIIQKALAHAQKQMHNVCTRMSRGVRLGVKRVFGVQVLIEEGFIKVKEGMSVIFLCNASACEGDKSSTFDCGELENGQQKQK